MYNISLDIPHSKPNGVLWRQKTNKELFSFAKHRANQQHNGLLLRVNSDSSVIFNCKFVHAAFGKSADQFIASDHVGRLILFELNVNRYRLITHLPAKTCAIKWGESLPKKVLVSLTDNTIYCIDLVSHKICGKLIGHKSPATRLSIHPRGILVLSSSNYEAFVWGLDDFTEKQKLSIKQNFELIETVFVGRANLITCFEDSSIFVWDINSFECTNHLYPPASKFFQYSSFTVFRDGQFLIAGGSSSELHVWDLNKFSISKTIELPSLITGVKSISVVENWMTSFPLELPMLAVFASDCVVNFVDISKARLCRISGHDSEIKEASVSPMGEFVLTILESGALDVYDLKFLSANNVASEIQSVRVKLRPSIKEAIVTDTNVHKWPDKPQGMQSNVTQKKHLDAGMDVQEKPTEDEEIKLDLEKLKSLLKGYGEYPVRYRTLIWKCLLKLPDNTGSFSSLEGRGIHRSFRKLEETFPISDAKLMRRFKKILSCLAFWSPIFGQVDYIPTFVFPFVKIITSNLQCFEVVASIFVNWCQHWFECYPCPPSSLLSVIDSLLKRHDQILAEHFDKHKITSQIYAMPLLNSAFSEVFDRKDWLKLWDHLFSNQPSYILSVIIAYNIIARSSLLSCSCEKDFQFFFHHQNPIYFDAVLAKAYRIQNDPINEELLSQSIPDFKPLSHATYPIFNKYPQYIIDYQASERERTQKDEMECQKLREIADSLDVKLKRLDQEEKEWEVKQTLLEEVGRQRQLLLTNEDKEFNYHRNKLLSLKNELQLKELCLLKSLRSKFTKEQQLHWQLEIQELETKILTKMKQHEREITSAMDDVKAFQSFLLEEKQNLEFELKNSLYQATKDTRQMLHSHDNDTVHKDIRNMRSECNSEQENQLKSVRQQYRKLIQADREEMNNLFHTKCRLMVSQRERGGVDESYKELRNLQQENRSLEQEMNAASDKITRMKIGSSEERIGEKVADFRNVSCTERGIGDNLNVRSASRDSLSDAFRVRQRLVSNMSNRYTTS